MCFEMRGVDHELIGLAALCGEFREDPVKHAQATPSDEPIVDGFVRAVTSWCIKPTKPILDHKDDAAHDPAIIDPRNAVRQREIRAQSDASAPRSASRLQATTAPLQRRNCINR